MKKPKTKKFPTQIYYIVFSVLANDLFGDWSQFFLLSWNQCKHVFHAYSRLSVWYAYTRNSSSSCHTAHTQTTLKSVPSDHRATSWVASTPCTMCVVNETFFNRCSRILVPALYRYSFDTSGAQRRLHIRSTSDVGHHYRTRGATAPAERITIATNNIVLSRDNVFSNEQNVDCEVEYKFYRINPIPSTTNSSRVSSFFFDPIPSKYFQLVL